MIVIIMIIIIIMTCQLHLAFPDPAPAEFLLIRFPYFMDLLLAGTQWGWLWGWGLCPWAALDTSGRVIWTLYDICVFDLNLVALQPRFFDWLVTLRTSCQRKRNPPGALALSRRLKSWEIGWQSPFYTGWESLRRTFPGGFWRYVHCF